MVAVELVASGGEVVVSSGFVMRPASEFALLASPPDAISSDRDGKVSQEE